MMCVGHVFEGLFHDFFAGFPVLLLCNCLEESCIIKTKEIRIACFLYLQQIAVDFAHRVNKKFPVIGCI